MEKESSKLKVNKSTLIRYLCKIVGNEAAYTLALDLHSTSYSRYEELESEASTESTARSKRKIDEMQFRIENYDGEVAYIEISPSEVTIDFLEKQVAKEFELGLDTFFLQYMDDGYAISLRTDEAMARCKRLMKDGQAVVKVKKSQR